MSKDRLPEMEKYIENIPDGAIEVYDYLTGEGCTPPVAAATATYTYLVESHRRVARHKIADEFGCSPETMSKWHSHLRKNADEWGVDSLPSVKHSVETDDVFWDVPFDLSDVDVEYAGRPSKGKRSGPTKEEMVREVLTLLEARRDATYETFIHSDLVQLTNRKDAREQVRILERDYGLAFGKGKDATLNIQITASGVEKILEQMPTSDK